MNQLEIFGNMFYDIFYLHYFWKTKDEQVKVQCAPFNEKGYIVVINGVYCGMIIFTDKQIIFKSNIYQAKYVFVVDNLPLLKSKQSCFWFDENLNNIAITENEDGTLYGDEDFVVKNSKIFNEKFIAMNANEKKQVKKMINKRKKKGN